MLGEWAVRKELFFELFETFSSSSSWPCVRTPSLAAEQCELSTSSPVLTKFRINFNGRVWLNLVQPRSTSGSEVLPNAPDARASATVQIPFVSVWKFENVSQLVHSEVHLLKVKVSLTISLIDLMSVSLRSGVLGFAATLLCHSIWAPLSEKCVWRSGFRAQLVERLNSTDKLIG